MKIIILGGFLGSGKTTVLMELVPCLTKHAAGFDHSVVVLENEVSMTDVDGKLLRGRGMEVRTLAAGCICCTCAPSLLDSLREIRRYEPAYLVIEATGVAFPDSIARILRDNGESDVTIAALADAKRWDKVTRAMPQFIESQVSQAEIIFLNKTDLVSPEKTESIRHALGTMAPNAVIYPVCAIAGIPEAYFASLV